MLLMTGLIVAMVGGFIMPLEMVALVVGTGFSLLALCGPWLFIVIRSCRAWLRFRPIKGTS
jgi:hypothetical protein